MGNIGNASVLGEAVLVLESYLEVLRALAVSEQGAGSMFAQLHRNAPRMLSWKRMLHAMKQYCDRYSLQADRQVAASALSTSSFPLRPSGCRASGRPACAGAAAGRRCAAAATTRASCSG